MNLVVGPARCADCHAPALFFDAVSQRWVERRYVSRQGTVTPHYVTHACTAREPVSPYRGAIQPAARRGGG